MASEPTNIPSEEAAFWETRKHFHLRINAAREAAWRAGFTTENEYTNPVEDNGAGDRLISAADLMQIYARQHPNATPRQLYDIARRDTESGMAERIDYMLEGMVATNPDVNTRASAEAFFVNTCIPAVQSVVRENAQLRVTGDAYFRRMQQEVMAEDGRIRPFVAGDSNRLADIQSEQRAVVASGAPRPAFLVQQGQMVTLDSRSLDAPVLLGTDFLMDCVAVVMVGRDPNDPNHIITTLSHLDIGVDPQQAIRTMVGTMPAGFTIEATMLGSSTNESPYMNSRILEALHSEPRLSSIRFNTNTASTVVVNSHTGAFFHHDMPDSEGAHNRIADGEFPFRVATNPVEIAPSSQPIEERRRALLYNELPYGNASTLFSLPLTQGSALPTPVQQKAELNAPLQPIAADGTVQGNGTFLAAVTYDNSATFSGGNLGGFTSPTFSRKEVAANAAVPSYHA